MADGTSSGPGFFTGLVIGILGGAALSTLFYVGAADELQRRKAIGARRAVVQRRRDVGYAYERGRRR